VLVLAERVNFVGVQDVRHRWRTAVPRVTKRFQEMEGVDDLAKCPEPFHRALWRPDGGGMATAGTIASQAYAPKPGAPARPAIVRKACQQLAGGENNTGETLLTQNRKHYLETARMLKRRLQNILTYLRHRVTNAASESINSKIQWVKYTARGFR
jgi:hypothetical protein